MKQVTSGVSGAAPIWRRTVYAAAEGRSKEIFPVPKNIVTAEKQLIKRYGNICNINDIKYFPYELNPTNGDYLIKMVKL